MRKQAKEAVGKATVALTRRRAVATAIAALVIAPEAGRTSQDEMRSALRDAIGDKSLENGALKRGRIALDIPALVENGNSVPLGIMVDSPMTARDHVTDIFVLSPENPLPQISRFKLGPRCGKAEIKTTIRLATSQHVHVVAVMNDGSAWLATEEVEVTTAACFDPT